MTGRHGDTPYECTVTITTDGAGTTTTTELHTEPADGASN